jgi:hypothetical protein
MTSDTPAAAVAVASPNAPRPADPEIVHTADTLRRIEHRYGEEGSGPGSRFEGRLLEDVQAEAVVRMVREVCAQLAEREADELVRGSLAWRSLRRLADLTRIGTTP